MGSLLSAPGMSALADLRQLNFGGFGTVSATYGTLIVLAISFAIAAIGALLYYGLLSMREQRYSSSQYYPRLLLTSPSDQDQVASLLKHLLRNSIEYDLR